MRILYGLLALLTAVTPAYAAGGATVGATQSFAGSALGIIAVLVFVCSYALVVTEEKTHLKKSIPTIIAAGVIWTLVATLYRQVGDTGTVGASLEHAFMEYGILFLFLLVAMTYVNTLQERNVFEVVRYKLLSYGWSQRRLFWATGTASFFLSPVLDNMTTALVMCSVATAVGAGNPRFVAVSAINIVIAANAGGAFSPFGDVTTYMVWAAGVVDFTEFFKLFVPALVNWLVPAVAMSLSVAAAAPHIDNEPVALKRGAAAIVALFALTIVLAVTAHQVFHVPAAMGMMLGLGLLKLYGYFLTRHEQTVFRDVSLPSEFAGQASTALGDNWKPRHKPFDTFISVKRAEWDTLLFFFGVLVSVAGLAQLGYLALVSTISYGWLGPTWTNTCIGILSAFVDNIPVMYAVLQMHPDMTHGQWLLVTLTAGTGGSLLSVGSAAGVALMGYAKLTDETGREVKVYTFSSHLKWTPVIALGYMAAIQTHVWLNSDVVPLW